MNLNRIYKIFGVRSPLSRKDITEYGKESDASKRHAIEMKEAASSFESDAMEGWEALDYDVRAMQKLDKRFLGNSTLGWYLGGTIAVAAIAVSLFIFTPKKTNLSSDSTSLEKEKLTVLLDDQEVTLEKSDIVLPDSIDRLRDLPTEQRIEPKKMQEEFKQMKTVYKEMVPPRIEMIALDEIRIPIRELHPEIIREHKTAAEIYLFDLKLVDYRKYRSKSTVPTKSLVLTGTPASREDENSSDPTSEMQELQIPYVEFISKTMRKFSRGSFKSALSRFDIILATYPDDVNANFYSGLCLYNLGEYEQAINRFLACRTSSFSNFDEEAQWMTALSYEKMGQHAKTKLYFEQIINQGGFYKKSAQSKMY